MRHSERPGERLADLTPLSPCTTIGSDGQPRSQVVRTAPYVAAVAHTRLYREGELVLEDFPVAEISEYLRDERSCVWLDYCAPTEAELATIVEEFELHPLAVEDAIARAPAARSSTATTRTCS